MGKLWYGQLGLGEEIPCDGSWKQTSALEKLARVFPHGKPAHLTPTQDERPQVRLQTLKLVCVILQLFLCDPPGVAVCVVRCGLLVQLLRRAGLGGKKRWCHINPNNLLIVEDEKQYLPEPQGGALLQAWAHSDRAKSVAPVEQSHGRMVCFHTLGNRKRCRMNKQRKLKKRQLHTNLLKTSVGNEFTAGSVGPVPLLAAGEAAVAQRGARR